MSAEELTSNDFISSLWSNSAIDKCRMGLSDAILYEAGLPVRWYVTGNAGEIKLKRHVDLQSISRRWVSISEQSEASYVAAIRQEGLVKFLSLPAWEAFVSDSKVADPALLSVHCFIGRGKNPIIYRNHYTFNPQSGRLKTLTHSYSIPKEELLHISYSERLQLVESKASQTSKVLDLATLTAVRFAEKMLRIRILHCSVDYVVDKKSQVWMLWANSVQYCLAAELRVSSPRSPGAPEAFSSTYPASTAASAPALDPKQGGSGYGEEEQDRGRLLTEQVQDLARQVGFAMGAVYRCMSMCILHTYVGIHYCLLVCLLLLHYLCTTYSHQHALAPLLLCAGA